MDNVFKRCLDACMRIGSCDDDDETLALKKSSLLLVPLIIGVAALIWGILYIFLGQLISASIPLSYTVISIFNLWHFQKTKNIIPLYKTQMVLVLLLPFFLMWSLGGFALGSYVMIWAFFAPIAALIYEKKTKALYWFYAFMALVLISTLIDQYLIQNHTNTMPQMAVELFFWLNITAGLSGVFFLIKYFINAKEENANVRLQQEHDALLRKTEELKEANSQLQYFAHHDALTSLANRYSLQTSLSKMIAAAKEKSQTLALLFIDLDGFKEINNNYGHATGDRLLEIIAKRLKSLLGDEDVIARVGGDEFVVVIGGLNDISSVPVMAQKFIDEIQKEYDFISSDFPVGASIGISLYPKHAKEIDALINLADKAMYKVKASTKNTFLFYDERMQMHV